MDFINLIIQDAELHAKWLNTLSYLENCGARKIAKCQHPTKVKEEMLKHAAEEFRHAYYLKRQIEKLPTPMLHDYTQPNILGGFTSLHYLNALDMQTCRFLRQFPKVTYAAYILVTYAIELRASYLYPLYHTALRENHSPVNVKSILLEEEEHLNEMRAELLEIPNGEILLSHVVIFETLLFKTWVKAIESELFSLI